jgi:chromosome segregation ATPase
MVAALEIMRASPKVSKMIEKGEISQIHEEIETSVGYYRMQSLNQSLMALLVHGTISYAEAMRQSPDPEDLSLKLRRMFPQIEEKGGEVVTSDFSEIVELQQFKRLYEEQEEKVKLLMSEKELEISALHDAIRERDLQEEELGRRLAEMSADREKLRGDYARLRQEAQEKIDKLMERIKELNQRLMGGGGSGGGGGEPERKTGIFR